jgi:hypothetical protein
MSKEKMALARLEAVIAKANTKFVMESDTEAFRTTDGTKKRRSHNLRLNPDSGILWWENESSKEWAYQFDELHLAQTWWNQMVVARSVQAKVAANEIDGQ